MRSPTLPAGSARRVEQRDDGAAGRPAILPAAVQAEWPTGAPVPCHFVAEVVSGPLPARVPPRRVVELARRTRQFISAEAFEYERHSGGLPPAPPVFFFACGAGGLCELGARQCVAGATVDDQAAYMQGASNPKTGRERACALTERSRCRERILPVGRDR